MVLFSVIPNLCVTGLLGNANLKRVGQAHKHVCAKLARVHNMVFALAY